MRQQARRFGTATVLTAVLAAACFQGSLAGSGAKVPASLQGEWHYGVVANIDYYDPATDKWTEGGGTSEVIKIAADGAYERTGLMVVTTYGCTSKLFVRDTGTVAVEGERVTFKPGVTNFSKGYTCTPSKIYEKQNAVAAKTYPWSVEGNILVLGGSRYRRSGS